MVLAALLQLDVGVLAMLSGTVIPLLVGLVAKRYAERSIKLLLNGALSALAGGLAAAIATNGTVEPKDWLLSMATTFFVSMTSYYLAYKPTGIAAAVQAIAPRFGIGPWSVDAIPVGTVHTSVPAAVTIAEFRAELEDMDRAALRALAKTAQVRNYSRMTKAELVDALVVF